MDSGNSSGSLQSSSGCGDEDSSSFSAFLNNNPPPPTPTHVGVVGPFNTSTSHTHMFDPLSNYLDPNPTQRSHPSLLNLDMMWSKPDRSEPNPTHLAHFLPCSSPPSSSSSSQHNQQVFLSTHQLQAGDQTRGSSCSAFLDTNQYTLPPESGSRGLLSASAATNNDDQGNKNVVRNPKKRSRASRRAPTTVLTTDTTNFRAMVQEFTGIPVPPFTSSPFPRTRFDLFPPPRHAATTPSTTLLDPPCLLRPFAQKLQYQQQHHLHPFPPPSSSMVDNLLASNNNSNNSTSINCHVSSPLNFNSVHNNPILSFQNILQQTPNYPLANSSSSSVLASTTQQQQLSLEIPQPSGANSHLKMGVLEELGLRHAHGGNNTNVSSTLHHHQNMVSSGNNNLSTAYASSMEWAQRTSVVTNNDCNDHGGGGVIRPLTLGGTVTNGKVHYSSASSSDFHGEKGSEECTTVAAPRSEGMVESWINCSSD